MFYLHLIFEALEHFFTFSFLFFVLLNFNFFFKYSKNAILCNIYENNTF